MKICRSFDYGLLALGLSPALNAGADASEAQPHRLGPATHAVAPCLAAVRQFADQVIAKGRDNCGKPTPLLVDGLNVDSHHGEVPGAAGPDCRGRL